LPKLMLANQKGVSLLSAMIGLGIVMVSIWGFMQASAGLKVQDVRLNRRIQGEALLASLGSESQRLLVPELEALCVARNGFASAPPSQCLSADGTALTSVAFDPAHPRDRLGKRIDLKPGNLAAGSTCVEISACRWRADGHLLEITLNASWTVPPGLRIAQRDLIFRKSR
jgi:hypothetical protein